MKKLIKTKKLALILSVVFAAFLFFYIPIISHAAVLLDHNYNSVGEAGCYTYWPNSAGTPYVTTDTTAPDGPSVLVFPLPSGLQGGDTPAACWESFPQNKEIWAQYHYKKSSNWVYQGVLDKQFFVLNTAPDANASGMYMGTGTVGGAPSCGFEGGFTWWSEVQAMYGGSGAGAEVRPINTSNACSVNPLTRNVWHKVKIHVKMNTYFANDGITQVWLDDVLITNWYNVNHNKYAPYFNNWNWNPIWGGMGGSLSATQWFYVDRLVVATAESDLLGGAPPDTTPPANPTGLIVS